MAPRVILISLDGCTDQILDRFLADGTLDPTRGLGLLRSTGVAASSNETITPSLTAPAHISIVTGSSPVATDINANTFHIVNSAFNANISGFAAPIGGYSFGPDGPVQSTDLTARPLWVDLRAAGKRVVTATFPGGDGATITLPGNNNVILQSSTVRTVDYTVPFGAFGGLGTRGFTLQRSNFTAAPANLVTQFTAAGRPSLSPILVADLEAIPATGTGSLIGGSTNAYNLRVAALDTSADNVVNYDTLVFFDANQPIPIGVPALPSTGPAYVLASTGVSQPFFFEGSNNRVGTAFFVSNLSPDLNNTRIIRYSANFIPRNTPVLSAVEDINNNVGFWAPQPDFRLTQRSAPGIATFPAIELERAYEDLVATFDDYQAGVAIRSIQQNPTADLVMNYFEQPDGSEHQFLLTDRRQATDISNPNSIGAGQDPAVIARYAEYVRASYTGVNEAVQRIIDTVGVDANGVPNSNIIVVSDHGFSPFHTVVNATAFLQSNNIDTTRVRAVTSGPAVNFYINLQGREPGGTVTPQEYGQLQQQILTAVRGFNDTNPAYTAGAARVPVFADVFSRAIPANPTLQNILQARGEFIGQDTGDVFALLTPGYNFDAVQNPVVIRSGDPVATTPVLSVPPFYGAHGYNPTSNEMQAVFYAAGPDINPGAQIGRVRNIDVAPTISQILGVPQTRTFNGRPIAGLVRASTLSANAASSGMIIDGLPVLVMLVMLLLSVMMRFVRRVRLSLQQSRQPLTLRLFLKAAKLQLQQQWRRRS